VNDIKQARFSAPLKSAPGGWRPVIQTGA
jgi:hypothetical protein